MTLSRRNKRSAAVAGIAIVVYLLAAGWLAKVMEVRPRLTLDPLACGGKRFSELAKVDDSENHYLFLTAVLAYSPDGQWLACRTSEAKDDDSLCGIQVWHAATGKEQARTIYLNESRMRDFDFPEWQFSPDGRFLVAGFYQGERQRMVRLLDLLTGQQRTFHAMQFAFSPDGMQLAIVENRGQRGPQLLRIVDTLSGAELARVDRCNRKDLGGDCAFCSITFLEGGNALAYVSYGPPAHLLKRKRGDSSSGIAILRWESSSHSKRFIGFADRFTAYFARDGKTVAVIRGRRRDRRIVLRDVASGELRGQLRAPQLGPIDAVKFSPDGATLTAISGASGGGGGSLPINSIAVWDLKSLRLIALRSNDEACPNGRMTNCYNDPNDSLLPRYAWRWYNGGGGSIVEVGSGRECLVFPDPGSDVTHSDYALTPDQKLLAVWEHSDRKPHLLWQWLEKLIPSIEAPAGGRDYRVRCWDMETGHAILPLPGCREGFAFAPDSRSVATLCDDGLIRVWELPPHRPLRFIAAWASLPAALVLVLAWWRGRRKTIAHPLQQPGG